MDNSDVVMIYLTYVLAEFVVWTLLSLLVAVRRWLPTVEDREGLMVDPHSGGVLFASSELTAAVLPKFGIEDLLEAVLQCPIWVWRRSNVFAPSKDPRCLKTARPM